MREWSLRAGDPLTLTLCADMRFAAPDYTNDHIWELRLSGGEPPSLSARTSYGLRARSMRIFYRFAEAGKSVTDPREFSQPPRVLRLYPNFLMLDFVPVEGIQVVAEYWVPESHVLAGRLTFTNQTTFPRHLDFELCGALSPLDGKPFGSPRQQQMVRVLSGKTSGLHPVVFMSGSPKSALGPHQALTIGLDFEAGTVRSVTWACAAESTDTASLELARVELQPSKLATWVRFPSPAPPKTSRKPNKSGASLHVTCLGTILVKAISVTIPGMILVARCPVLSYIAP